ncbi:hypothetical protein NPX13_g1632 [Xylaria arbuscula]|uniref:Clr5 domain-containing protein n=1 Tax=Xylaria arbuscula TaxID=114810 RepID=A0A9W8NKN7_9PEZI|nr:hypothetical protein NPX13_g1632 [Xylaria arbuscula]
MEHVPDRLYPTLEQDRHLDISYKNRWECLKPVIVELYMGSYDPPGGKTLSLDQVVQFMKTNYFFHAAVWGIAKQMTKEMKEDALNALARLKRPETSTYSVTVTREGRNQQVHPNKLMRHLKKQKRRHVVDVVPGLFSSWNLPYKAFIASIFKNQDEPSPFQPAGVTPEGLNIQSPKPLTPGREIAAASPNMQLVYQKCKEDRAVLFLEGRLDELVDGMPRDERKFVVNYFHDFFMSSLVMARNWGSRLADEHSVVNSIHFPQNRPIEMPSNYSSPSAFESSDRADAFKAPTQLCNWSIHIAVTPNNTHGVNHDLVPPPQAQPTAHPFQDELRETLLCNNSTKLSLQDLPLAHDVIIDTINKDPRILAVDAWKFAIMAGNPWLLEQLFYENGECPDKLDSIHPFHLAASFLYGGNACCKVFEVLCDILGPEYPFHHNIDSCGHTILDTLMVSILRSHTKIEPAAVSYSFRSPNRFPGEEVDICGRWTLDTPGVRDLFQRGISRIPNAWKHPFCHTAVQAVCHSIITIFGPSCAPSINKTSGLFVRRCTECGMELKLGSLHALVVTVFYLAQAGMAGETLFGGIAVLLYLLSLGADATATANISVEAILGISETANCCHVPLSPRELMESVPKEVIDNWADDIKVGWGCFAQILSRASKEGNSQPQHDLEMDSEMGCENDCEDNGDWLNVKCHDAEMGLIWATVQAEILTYRRVNEGDAWISQNFSLRALDSWLSGDSAEFLTPLVTNQMMQAHSKCGWFHRATCFVRPTALEVSARPIMDMDLLRTYRSHGRRLGQVRKGSPATM